MADVVALEFADPAGEALRIEWDESALAALDPRGANGDPAWRLGGELDWDEVEALRVVSGRLGDGRLIALAAVRPSGGPGHGAEVVACALGEPGSLEAVTEALLSTEYGPDGMPRRIGLELQAGEDAIPERVAGDAVETRVERSGAVERTSVALELRAGGTSGAGTIDVLRAAP